MQIFVVQILTKGKRKKLKKSYTWNELAGRLSSNTRSTGKVLINGHRQELADGTSVRLYISQKKLNWHEEIFHFSSV